MCVCNVPFHHPIYIYVHVYVFKLFAADHM